MKIIDSYQIRLNGNNIGSLDTGEHWLETINSFKETAINLSNKYDVYVNIRIQLSGHNFQYSYDNVIIGPKFKNGIYNRSYYNIYYNLFDCVVAMKHENIFTSNTICNLQNNRVKFKQYSYYFNSEEKTIFIKDLAKVLYRIHELIELFDVIYWQK